MLKMPCCKSCDRILEYRDMVKVTLFTGVRGTVKCTACGAVHFVPMKSQQKIAIPGIILMMLTIFIGLQAALIDSSYYLAVFVLLIIEWFAIGILAPFALETKKWNLPLYGKCWKCGHEISIDNLGASAEVKCPKCSTPHALKIPQ
jgi:CXXC-20-CXXC protein